MAETETDAYEWWRNACEGLVAPIDVNEPASGYYKLGRKDKDRNVTFSAVAYWRDNAGSLQCRVDGQALDEQRAVEIWPHASKRPISYELYEAVRRGEPWPGENAVVTGHNQAPVADDITSITDRIEDLAREAERMITAGAAADEGKADQASDLANTLGELEAKVKKLHETEKAPHLEAGREVDRKWFPLRDRAADLKARLKRLVVTPFLAKKSDETRRAQVAAIAQGAAPEELPQARLVAGSSKRSTGLRTFYRAEITDKAALLDSLKDHPDVMAVIQKIADDAAKKKIALPGCKVVSEQRAA